MASGEQLDLRYAQAVALAPRALLIGLLPMALYLTSVFTVLLADVFRALLDTPEKIHSVAEALKASR